MLKNFVHLIEPGLVLLQRLDKIVGAAAAENNIESLKMPNNKKKN